jgi:hypothetical protein
MLLLHNLSSAIASIPALPPFYKRGFFWLGAIGVTLACSLVGLLVGALVLKIAIAAAFSNAAIIPFAVMGGVIGFAVGGGGEAIIQKRYHQRSQALVSTAPFLPSSSHALGRTALNLAPPSPSSPSKRSTDRLSPPSGRSSHSSTTSSLSSSVESLHHSSTTSGEEPKIGVPTKVVHKRNTSK